MSLYDDAVVVVVVCVRRTTYSPDFITNNPTTSFHPIRSSYILYNEVTFYLFCQSKISNNFLFLLRYENLISTCFLDVACKKPFIFRLKPQV